MKQLYRLKIATGLEYESIGELDLDLHVGDQVVIKCERYLDYATVTERVGEAIEDEEAFVRRRAQQSKGRHIEGQKIPQILRKASDADRAQAEDNARQSRVAHLQTMERIKAHGLEMKLIHTHYAFDRKLIIFQFSADGRIDFRELLRDLSGLLKVRVELRQVGVRDEASILGGIGTCGRPFCCASFLPSFNSINVKMAKQQGLSLNPQNISGCCGRLKCCLQYEAEAYREMWEENKKKQAGGGSASPTVHPPKEAAAEVESEPSMFEEEGTIVSARPVSVPSANGNGEASGSGNRRPPRSQHGGQDGHRERGDHGDRGNQNRRNGNTGGSQGQGGNRPQRNPQKHPLPPAGGDSGMKTEEVGSGNGRSGRGSDRRRDRHNGDRRREGGDRDSGSSRPNRSEMGSRSAVRNEGSGGSSPSVEGFGEHRGERTSGIGDFGH